MDSIVGKSGVLYSTEPRGASRVPAMGISELKQDIGRWEAGIASLEAKIWRVGLTIAGAAVLFDRFLDWIINK